MNELNELIRDYFIMKFYNIPNAENIKICKEFYSKMLGTYKKYSEQLKIIENFINEFDTQINDMVNFIEDDIKDDYVRKLKNNIMYYKGSEIFVVKQPPTTLTEVKKNKAIEKFNTPLGYKIKMQKITNLKSIPSMFWVFENNFYCNINSNICKVPFPKISNGLTEESKHKTIRCYYKSRENCNEKKGNKNCYFSHTGEEIKKVGVFGRCNKNMSFGNPDSFIYDIDKMEIEDAKNLLLYGLNDVFLGMIVLDNLGIKNDKFLNLDIS